MYWPFWIQSNLNLISHAEKTTQKTRVSTWSLNPPCRKLTDNGSRLHTMFRQLLFQIFISQICHLHFLCARFVCLFGCFLQNDLNHISHKSQFTLLQSSHTDDHGIIRYTQIKNKLIKKQSLTLPDRLLLDTTGAGNSSSLEKVSAGGFFLLFSTVKFFRYSCTYTSFLCSPLGSGTLLAVSSFFSLSFVRTDGSSRNSAMF